MHCDDNYEESLRNVFAEILKTRPVSCNPEAQVEIHTLTAHNHLSMYLTALKSFLRFYNNVLPVVYDDGTFSKEDLLLLRYHIPGIKVFFKKDIEPIIDDLIRDYPYCKKYKNAAINWQELFSLMSFFKTKKMMIVNSDILFLKRPDEIIQWIENDNNQIIYAYEDCPCMQKEFLINANCDFPPNVTLACICFYNDIFDLDLIEKTLKKSKFLKEYAWVEGQNTYPVLFKKKDDKYVYNSFDKDTYEGSGIFKEGAIFRHYMASTGKYKDIHIEDAKKVIKNINESSKM